MDLEEFNSQKRGSNMTDLEKKMFVELCRERTTIIENKKYDKDTLVAKRRAWQEITNHFNSCCYGSKRTVKFLQGCWKRLKMDTKRGIDTNWWSASVLGGAVAILGDTGIENPFDPPSPNDDSTPKTYCTEEADVNMLGTSPTSTNNSIPNQIVNSLPPPQATKTIILIPTTYGKAITPTTNSVAASTTFIATAATLPTNNIASIPTSNSLESKSIVNNITTSTTHNIVAINDVLNTSDMNKTVPMSTSNNKTAMVSMSNRTATTFNKTSTSNSVVPSLASTSTADTPSVPFQRKRTMIESLKMKLLRTSIRVEEARLEKALLELETEKKRARIAEVELERAMILLSDEKN